MLMVSFEWKVCHAGGIARWRWRRLPPVRRSPQRHRLWRRMAQNVITVTGTGRRWVRPTWPTLTGGHRQQRFREAMAEANATMTEVRDAILALNIAETTSRPRSSTWVEEIRDPSTAARRASACSTSTT